VIPTAHFGAKNVEAKLKPFLYSPPALTATASEFQYNANKRIKVSRDRITAQTIESVTHDWHLIALCQFQRASTSVTKATGLVSMRSRKAGAAKQWTAWLRLQAAI